MADKIQYIQIPTATPAPTPDLPQQKVNEVGYLPPHPTNVNPSISLKEYFDSQISEKEKRYEQRFTAQQEAVLKAEAANEKRFESVNEFRNTLKDQQEKFVSKDEVKTAMEYMGKSITKNQDDLNDIRLKSADFLSADEYSLRHTELQLQITAIRDVINTNMGKTAVADPVNDEKFNILTKTLEALSIKIGSLNDTRNTESGATAKASSIFTRAETMIPILIAVGLFVLRLIDK